MAEGSNGRRRFSDKWGKHELDVLAVLSSAFPQWLTSRQIAQRVKAYADSYGELADQAAKAAFAKQFQRDRAKLAAMGIAIESRQPEYSSKSEGQDFASYRLQLGDEPRLRISFEPEDLPVLAAANYLARSVSITSQQNQQEQQEQQARKQSRNTPRVPQMPVPGLGLDSIAPGLGTQSIPDKLVKVVEQRRFTATVETDGEEIHVAYTDSDDLATFVLEHPGAVIKSPQEAVDSFKRRLNAACNFKPCDDSSKTTPIPVADYVPASTPETDNEPGNGRKTSVPYQTGSEVDRRLRLMLFLSAHLGEEFSLESLADRFVGHPHDQAERKRGIAVIKKDVERLTTVSDDGEMAGSQFFDFDWTLLEEQGIVCATNSLGLERLAGISPQYLSLLTASVSYLAHSPVMPEDSRRQAENLYQRLQKQMKPGDSAWLSLTGYELEPPCYTAVKEAITSRQLLDMEYTDGAGRTRRKLVAPAKIYVDEGVYYAAVWNGVKPSDVEPGYDFPAQQHEPVHPGKKHPEWQTLRLARIGHLKVVAPVHPMDIPDVPLSELREWNVDNGTPADFITDTVGHSFIRDLPYATVEPWGDGEKVHLLVCSDSWFVAFCIAHARHILAVGPETLRTMMIARAKHEMSIFETE
ncbi:WYL domain-containing protein [Pseudoscardovia radai]|jgi:predicted DNA-binding transcriptional regulator YafY|uniref:WYL domain-containing protein n=1 Tax=Pseudoscardovia radai TaxID=987066 RepID=A0A261F2B2_9BIFI|nr:WYL domain-containing protein [Pseudoscardovia radai]OZG53238.1 WYL domain-containing protein [Pseudoscardovia radai]